MTSLTKSIIILLIGINLMVTSVNAAEYYGVEWPYEIAATLLIDKGYYPEKISKIMYQANDQCSKSVRGMKSKKAKICIEYKCGIVTKYVNIDKYTDAVNVSSSTECGWF